MLCAWIKTRQARKGPTINLGLTSATSVELYIKLRAAGPVRICTSWPIGIM
jgi:hypothetical protein